MALHRGEETRIRNKTDAECDLQLPLSSSACCSPSSQDGWRDPRRSVRPQISLRVAPNQSSNVHRSAACASAAGNGDPGGPRISTGRFTWPRRYDPIVNYIAAAAAIWSHTALMVAPSLLGLLCQSSTKACTSDQSLRDDSYSSFEATSAAAS
jgi:hypothetical protein